MVRSLNSHQMATFPSNISTHNTYRLHLEYLQILSRHTNDIKHSFIFKKPFINVFHTYNGITLYKMPFHDRLMSRLNTTIFLLSFLGQSTWILSMSFSVNSSVFPLQISTIWAGLLVMLQPMCHSPFSMRTLALLFSS